jgi:hypothetical protein
MGPERDTLARRFDANRTHLRAVAHRTLGSATRPQGVRRMNDRPTQYGPLSEVVDLTVGLGIVLLPLTVIALPGVILLLIVPLALLAAPVALLGALAVPPYLLVRALRRR